MIFLVRFLFLFFGKKIGIWIRAQICYIFPLNFLGLSSTSPPDAEKLKMGPRVPISLILMGPLRGPVPRHLLARDLYRRWTPGASVWHREMTATFHEQKPESTREGKADPRVRIKDLGQMEALRRVPRDASNSRRRRAPLSYPASAHQLQLSYGQVIHFGAAGFHAGGRTWFETKCHHM